MFTGVFSYSKVSPKERPEGIGFRVSCTCRTGTEKHTGTEPEKEDAYVWSNSWRYDRKPF